MGEAVGETFLAVDSLIRSFTIWRVAPEADIVTPMKLWITEVNSAGTPLVDRVIFSGPTITVTNGDRIHPTKIQYAFDPPRPLERGRKYFFAVQERCYFYFDVLLAAGDAYPDGQAWRTRRTSNSGCVLLPGPDGFPDYDLVFTIEFCRNAETPVRPTTWGRLKVIYR